MADHSRMPGRQNTAAPQYSAASVRPSRPKAGIPSGHSIHPGSISPSVKSALMRFCVAFHATDLRETKLETKQSACRTGSRAPGESTSLKRYPARSPPCSCRKSGCDARKGPDLSTIDQLTECESLILAELATRTLPPALELDGPRIALTIMILLLRTRNNV